MAARFVRDEEAAGSNPATPTRSEGMRSSPTRLKGVECRAVAARGDRDSRRRWRGSLARFL